MKAMIKSHLQGKKVLILFCATQLIFAYMILVSIPLVLNGNSDLRILDMMPSGYDIDYINKLFKLIGHEGRNQYLYHQLVVDTLYPLCFGISYTILLAYFLHKLKKLDTPLFYLCGLPIIATLSDYLENIGIINLLRQYDDIKVSSVRITQMFSIIKSSCSTIFFVVLLATILFWCFQYFKKSKSFNPSQSMNNLSF